MVENFKEEKQQVDKDLIKIVLQQLTEHFVSGQKSALLISETGKALLSRSMIGAHSLGVESLICHFPRHVKLDLKEQE